jgi:branched-chain amino acid transport system substrate-binding protein
LAQEIGAKGLLRPIEITCANHEGDGPVFIQQWTGDSWEQVTDWIEPISDVTRPKVEAAAKAYAEENGLPIRDCSKES